jgi:hypothetical protein
VVSRDVELFDFLPSSEARFYFELLTQTDRFVLSYPRKRVSTFRNAAMDSRLRGNDNMRYVIVKYSLMTIPR